MKYSDKQIKSLLESVYRGEITTGNLPEDLYYAIANYIKQGLYDGYGGGLAAFEGKPLALLTELRENVYMFSGAKTYQQVRELSDALYTDSGIKPFNKWRDEAIEIYDKYNKNWARTEYDTAIASGQQGALWNKIEEDAEVLPLLQMSVVEDANTTIICRPLEGITLPVNDPFWRKYYPPNHWQCRSSVIQLSEGTISSKKDISHAVKHAEEDMQPIFKMNVGLDKVVFSDKHPYFDVEPKDKKFARNNFDLPIPAKD